MTLVLGRQAVSSLIYTSTPEGTLLQEKHQLVLPCEVCDGVAQILTSVHTLNQRPFCVSPS